VFDANPSRSHIFGELGLDHIEGGAINDGLVLAGMGLAAIDHLAEVEAVLEEMGQRADAVGPPPLVRPLAKLRTFAMTPRRASSSAKVPTEPHSRYSRNMVRTVSASAGTTTSFLFTVA
jgi:hypothetical protein